MSNGEYKDLPNIAIIGRPNVGKSSVFNRILKRRKAITESTPGVTRDRLYAHVTLGQAHFILIDTGGIISRPKEKIAQLVYKQSKEAIDEADAVIFVCDVISGVTYQDVCVAQLLKKSNKKTFLVVNKVDNNELKGDIFDFYKLGFGEPHGLSALHGRSFDELYEDITSYLLSTKRYKKREGSFKGSEPAAAGRIKIAVVGRPNVGKSSFVNCILNEDRLLVDEMPGTTRDSVDVSIRRDKEQIILIDTAGIRHKRKFKEVVEVFSLARTKQAIKRCDAAAVMIDVAAGLLREDIAIIAYVIKEGKPCVLAVNKQDLISGLDLGYYRKQLRRRLNLLEWIPIIFTSCRNRQNIIRVLDIACRAVEKARIIIPTPKINELLERLQKENPHPSFKGAHPKIFYSTQIESSPPRFILFCSNPKFIKNEYIRFIEKAFRKEFGLEAIPLYFQLRARG